MTAASAKRTIERAGFGVLSTVLLNGGTVVAAQVYCPCGRTKWFRLPADDVVGSLQRHLVADGLV